MKKKVLYIITKSVWGGAQKYVHDLAVNLPKNDFDVSVAGGGNGPMSEKIKSANINYFEIKNFQRDVNFIKEFFSFFEILKILLKVKPDIVHVSSSKAGGVAGAAFLAYSILSLVSVKISYKSLNFQKESSKKKLLSVFTVHGWAFLEKRPFWQIWLIKFFSKLTCLFYDKIICVSENDHKEAIKNNISPTAKLVTIHNGVRSEDYDFLERDMAKQELAIKEADLVIGTIGEFTKNKGHDYLIKAAKLPTTKHLSIFAIIGWGEEKENYESKIKKEGLVDKVFVLDKNELSDQKTANYLKAFDIFVLPSVKEGLPTLILEAGLAGLPVVATNVGGIPEIIDDGKDGILVPPANPKRLAAAIKDLADDKNSREKMAQNLHQKITHNFTLEKMLLATIAAYGV